MPGNPYQRAAELEVLESAVRQLGWPAVDGNAPGHRSFGWDVQLLLPAAVMETAPVNDAEIVREVKRRQLHRLSAELDAARPELIVTLGNAALRALRLLVEIDAGDPGPALRPEAYGSETIVRRDRGRARWLPLVHPRPGARTPKWREIHARWEAQRR